jgi:hypothetical protein
MLITGDNIPSPETRAEYNLGTAIEIKDEE